MKFCKRILGVHNKATNLAVYGELGCFPLICKVASLVVKFWIRIKDPYFENTLIGKAANLSLSNNYQSASFTNYVLRLCDFNELTNIQVSNNCLERFMKDLKSKLIKIWSDYWKSELSEMSQGKLRTYCIFKPSLNFENYLNLIENCHFRSAVTKLRISAHSLPVESGRYKKIPLTNRTCNLCSLNLVGDEFHYFFECNHSDIETARYNFLCKLYNINENFKKFDKRSLFIYILPMNDNSISHITSCFCYKILKIFKNICI